MLIEFIIWTGLLIYTALAQFVLYRVTPVTKLENWPWVLYIWSMIVTGIGFGVMTGYIFIEIIIYLIRHLHL